MREIGGVGTWDLGERLKKPAESPIAGSVVSYCIRTRVDSVSFRGNDFFVFSSLSIINLLPRYQIAECKESGALY